MLACIDAAHTALTVRALMTGSADLALPSTLCVRARSLGEPPLLRAVASSYLLMTLRPNVSLINFAKKQRRR